MANTFNSWIHAGTEILKFLLRAHFLYIIYILYWYPKFLKERRPKKS